MDRDETLRMAEVEDTMWWYRTLHGHLLRLVETHAPGCARLLDAGSGTGGFLRRARERWPALDLVGVEKDPLALDIARERTQATFVEGDVGALPFEDGRFDVVVSADVIYHQDVDPDVALGEAHRCLAPGGIVVVNVPAYEWLRSYHDVAIRTGRRFTRRELVERLARAGLDVIEATHWNAILLPMIVAKRKLVPRNSGSDVHPYAPWLDRRLHAALAWESRLIGLSALPFGCSILAVGRRRG